MKKGVLEGLLVVLVLVLFGIAIKVSSSEAEYETKVIDGCEYLERDPFMSYKAAITHKGNCSNPIHKQK